MLKMPAKPSSLSWMAGKAVLRTAEYLGYLRIGETGLTPQTARIEGLGGI